MAASVGNLFINLVARTGRFERGMKRAGGEVNSFTRRATSAARMVGRLMPMLTGGAVAGGFAMMVRRQMQAVDTIAKTSDKLGVATEELVGFHHAAERSGVETRTFDMALQRMTRRLSEAAHDTGEAKAALKELGVDAQRLSKLGPAEALRQIADALKAVPNQADRVRLAFKLFDSEGVAMVNVLAQGSAGLAKMQAEAEKLGLTFSRIDAAQVEAARDAMANLGQALSAFGRAAAIELSPYLAIWARDLTDALTGTGEAAEKTSGKLQRFQQMKDKEADSFTGRMTDLADLYTKVLGTTEGTFIQRTPSERVAFEKQQAQIRANIKRLGLGRGGAGAGKPIGDAALEGFTATAKLSEEVNKLMEGMELETRAIEGNWTATQKLVEQKRLLGVEETKLAQLAKVGGQLEAAKAAVKATEEQGRALKRQQQQAARESQRLAEDRRRQQQFMRQQFETPQEQFVRRMKELQGLFGEGDAATQIRAKAAYLREMQEALRQPLTFVGPSQMGGAGASHALMAAISRTAGGGQPLLQENKQQTRHLADIADNTAELLEKEGIGVAEAPAI